MADPILAVDNVTLRYKTPEVVVTATERVSFHVDASDRFVLLGPSGCGKSTLLNIISGIQRPDAGQVAINGIPARDFTDWHTVSYLFQEDRLRRIGPGLYRITQPIHVDGTWKTTLRLHKDRQLAGLPIFMPADPAIPVAGIPVASHMTRSFELDHHLLQREQKKGVPSFLTLAAYLGVGGISFALIFVVGWGLARLDRLGGKPPSRSPERAGAGGKQPGRGRKPGTRPAPA